MKVKLTVIVATFMEDVNEIRQCVAPLLAQKRTPVEVVVLEQAGRSEVQENLAAIPSYPANSISVLAIPDNSLSFARNAGIELASADLIAFLDPDAVPGDQWPKAIVDCFAGGFRPAVMAGRILPLYDRPPGFLNRSHVIMEQQSTLDLGLEPRYIDRAIGANFAIDRKATGDLRFDETLGRQKGLLHGGEETAFCEAVESGGGRIVYCPAAMVQHRIPRSRMRIHWLARRFYQGGASRGQRGGKPARINRAPWTLNDFAAMIVLIVPYLAGLVRGRLLAWKGGMRD